MTTLLTLGQFLSLSHELQQSSSQVSLQASHVIRSSGAKVTSVYKSSFITGYLSGTDRLIFFS